MPKSIEVSSHLFLKFFGRFAFLTVFFCLNISAYAQDTWDAEVTAGLRTYPLGAAVAFNGGYNDYLWGKKSEDPLSWGYFRLGALAQSSGKVNKGELSLSVFPVPLIGLNLDFGGSARNLTSMQTVDCVALNCFGNIRRTRIGAVIKGAFGYIFGRIKTSYAWLEPANASIAHADESTNLEIQRGGDRLFNWNFILGLPMKAEFQTFIFVDKNKMQNGGYSNISRGIAAQKSWGQHAVKLGAALYSSETSKLHGQVFAGYSYSISKGLEL